MTIEKAIDILKAHNEWRQSGLGEMANPKELTMAIKLAIEVLTENITE